MYVLLVLVVLLFHIFMHKNVERAQESIMHKFIQLIGARTDVLGMTLNSSVVVLSTTLNSCGAIEEMIL